MSINALLEKAVKEGAERLTPEKVTELLERLEAKIPPPSDDAWRASVRGLSIEALGKLKPMAPQLAGHTREGLFVFLSYAATADEDKAMEAWLRDAALPSDLVSALLDSADAAIAERQRRDAFIASVKETGKTLLRELGPLAARYLLPLLAQAAAGAVR